MKRICIHQPDFLPYLGFFHRLLVCDIFVIHDDVQFMQRGWHHRDKIKTKKGSVWLTLPVQKGDYHRLINQVMLSKDNGARYAKNLNLLEANYIQAPYFNEYFPTIRDIYLSDCSRLMDLNMSFLRFFLDLFDIKIEIVFASELNVEGYRNQKIINLIKAIGAAHYLSGCGARAYLDEQMFADEGITVEWQRFSHPVYPQLHGDFIPELSCIDLLFNCGVRAKEILYSCIIAK